MADFIFFFQNKVGPEALAKVLPLLEKYRGLWNTPQKCTWFEQYCNLLFVIAIVVVVVEMLFFSVQGFILLTSYKHNLPP